MVSRSGSELLLPKWQTVEVAAVEVRLEGRVAAAAEIVGVELVVEVAEEEGSVVIEAGLEGLHEGAASSTGG